MASDITLKFQKFTYNRISIVSLSFNKITCAQFVFILFSLNFYLLELTNLSRFGGFELQEIFWEDKMDKMEIRILEE